jgi:hypothetical protein
MVDFSAELNYPLMKRFIRQLFPTAVSPTNTNLNDSESGNDLLFFIIIFITKSN